MLKMENQNLEQEVKEQKKEIEKLKKKSRLQKWINLFLIWK
jgi:predicted RNase H-like nuclease (RuvC/YqgF family)